MEIVHLEFGGRRNLLYAGWIRSPAGEAERSPFGANVYGDAAGCITQRSLVRARVLSAGKWSALVEAIFLPPQDWSALVLTEIMYNPIPASGFTGDVIRVHRTEERRAERTSTSPASRSPAASRSTFANGTLIPDPARILCIGRERRGVCGAISGRGAERHLHGEAQQRGRHTRACERTRRRHFFRDLSRRRSLADGGGWHGTVASIGGRSGGPVRPGPLAGRRTHPASRSAPRTLTGERSAGHVGTSRMGRIA